MLLNGTIWLEHFARCRKPTSQIDWNIAGMFSEILFKSKADRISKSALDQPKKIQTLMLFVSSE